MVYFLLFLLNIILKQYIIFSVSIEYKYNI